MTNHNQINNNVLDVNVTMQNEAETSAEAVNTSAFSPANAKNFNNLIERINSDVGLLLFQKSMAKLPVRSIWMSQLGHPCLRFLIYKLTRYQEEAPLSIASVENIESGHVEEEKVLKILRDLGYVVHRCQEHVEIPIKGHPNLFISGRLDGILQTSALMPTGQSNLPEWIPFEIKSVDPFIFQTVNSLEDLENRGRYYQNYRAQMVLYMYGKRVTEMLLLLTPRGKYTFKALLIQYDATLAEQLIKKARQIAKHTKTGTLPEPINNPQICPTCSFAHICPHELPFNCLEDIPQDPELEQLIKREIELKKSKIEYEKVHEQIKEKLATVKPGEYLFRRYLIQIKEQQRTMYEIPNEIRQQFAVKKAVRCLQFEDLGTD